MDESLESLVERYGGFVHASARRRTGSDALADEVTRAVFLVLARRRRKLRKKIVLAAWLFEITKIAARKNRPSRFWPWPWFTRRREVSPGATLWERIAPRFDRELDRLPRRQREAFLLLHVLGVSQSEGARMLRSREQRVEKRAQRALQKLAWWLRRVLKTEPCPAGSYSDVFAREVAQYACAVPSDELLTSIRAAIEEAGARRPTGKLARRVLRSLAFVRWRRRVVMTAGVFLVLLTSVLGAAWYLDSRIGHSQSIAWFIEWQMKSEARRIPGVATPAKRWPTNDAAPQLSAREIRSANEIYRSTNIWLAHLTFSRNAWRAVQPKRIGAMPHFIAGDGTIHLRNPAAQRSGVAGVLGFDFDWAQADFEIGGVRFTNVGARFKGNGTFFASLHGEKRAFKVDLNHFTKGQRLAGCDEFTLNNLKVDDSFVSDALAYEFFRDAGVPAPRTAYAYVSLSVDGKWERKPLGLYALIESVDGRFTTDRLGTKGVLLFKPVTYELFQFRGEDWSAYDAIYDAKGKTSIEQQQRVIELARLVSKASDAEFAMRIGELLDLDNFARFLAANVLLANYDSILANGQNFYLYLDPRTKKFGFIPWDLDLSWGSFFLLASTEERERASIWHPCAGERRNIFVERVMNVEEFRKLYRAQLEHQLATLFTRERLFPRIDELARTIRPAVDAESEFRLERFEQAIGDNWPDRVPRGGSHGADRPVHYLKRFILKRAQSVRLQLDGKSKGMVFPRGNEN